MQRLRPRRRPSRRSGAGRCRALAAGGNARDRIKLVFGRDFPVHPRFTLGPYAGEVAASLADRAALLDDDTLALAGWLPKLARVRDGADRLNAALSAHEALDDSLAGRGRFERVAAAARAGSLGRTAVRVEGAGSEEVVPQIASSRRRRCARTLEPTRHSPDSCATSGRNSSDHIQTTGISFHYDAPGARAPSPSCSQCRRN